MSVLKKKVRLFNEQNGICYLCEEMMTLEDVSVDHVIPKKYGGHSGPQKAAHKICNSFRGHALDTIHPDIYRANREKVMHKLKKRAIRNAKKKARDDNKKLFEIHPIRNQQENFPAIDHNGEGSFLPNLLNPGKS
jgi:5-methylcytosine-specific restriction endonuclease McrA